MGLLVAGHETTANMIGKMVAMLLADRTRWERLPADPALVRTAVDEALRFDANLGFGIRRYLTEDVEVDGELLPSGTTVVCSMPAANRDERVFADADDMVLSRSPNPPPHLRRRTARLPGPEPGTHRAPGHARSTPAQAADPPTRRIHR
ncbi:cytochrome P450 [Streptomyces sp. NBC_01017]|nr:cytochrome P450 [Streptomyces sp. NBC_01017]